MASKYIESDRLLVTGVSCAVRMTGPLFDYKNRPIIDQNGLKYAWITNASADSVSAEEHTVKHVLLFSGKTITHENAIIGAPLVRSEPRPDTVGIYVLQPAQEL